MLSFLRRWLPRRAARADNGRVYRNKWYELSFGRSYGVALLMGHGERLFLHFALPRISLYLYPGVVVKKWLTLSLGGPRWGFCTLDNYAHFYWGKKTVLKRLPWSWVFIRSEVLSDYGWRTDRPAMVFETRIEYQGTIAVVTMTGDRRYYRLLFIKRLPIFNKVNTVLQFKSNEELGRGAGSWKGGVMGSSFPWDGVTDPVVALKAYLDTNPF